MAAPTRVSTGGNVLAANIDQFCDILNRQSTQTEIGYHYENGWANASTDNWGYGISTLSRDATPSTVTVGVTLQAASGCNAPATNTLNAAGFHVFTSSTGASTNFFVGGLYTSTY
jgi:hypothetical protein